jgi:hypothetical protein
MASWCDPQEVYNNTCQFTEFISTCRPTYYEEFKFSLYVTKVAHCRHTYEQSQTEFHVSLYHFQDPTTVLPLTWKRACQVYSNKLGYKC